MNVLFFTEISPFPINGGEKIRSYGLLKSLSDLQYNITAVIRNESKINISLYEMDNVSFITYENKELSNLGVLLNSFLFKPNKEVIRIFDNEISTQKFDLAFLDYQFACRYISYFKKRDISVIMGTHNTESNLVLQKPTSNIFKYIRKMQLYYSILYLEKFIYKKADALLTVSDKDSDYHAKYFPAKKIFMIPNFLDERRYITSYKKENHFVMTANFNAYMNFEGLKWFVNTVWDTELDNNNKLFLVGKKSKEAFNELKINDKFKNIIAIGLVDDMVPYIAKAKAVIIPLLHGSGSRLKCLEAMALSTPIITTSKGVEGVKSNSFIVVDNELDFRKSIQTYEYSSTIGDALYKDFNAEYSIEVNKKRIEEVVKNIMNP